LGSPDDLVKPYTKRGKSDAIDAEAICEAVTRPTMRFVPIKSAEAQSVLMLHRARHLLVRQRMAQVSAMRAHFAEYGIVAAKVYHGCATCSRCSMRVPASCPSWPAKRCC
jgi:transposase